MGMPAPRYYTAEMVRDLPDDGNRYEVVYSELLVTPAPRLWHQVLVQRLTVALDGYLRTEPVGVVLTAPRRGFRSTGWWTATIGRSKSGRRKTASPRWSGSGFAGSLPGRGLLSS